MRPCRTRPMLFAGLLLACLPVAGQTVETLLLQTNLESQLLVEALGRYRRTRDAARDAVTRVTELSTRLDGQIEAGNRPVADLRRLEGELLEATEIAQARLAAVARARLQIYDHRGRLALLEQRLNEAGGGPLVPDSGVSGLWQVTVEPGGVFGLLRIQADGTLLSGTYVWSNGDQGSVRGTVVDNEVVIERIDATRGFVSTLEGRLDAPGGRLDGRWTAKDLTAGRPTTGTWTGRRLTTRSAVVDPS